MSIFEKRVAFKPFEYPELVEYKNAVSNSFWLVGKWNYISDIQDFKVKLTSIERNIIKNAMLAISQIEVDVKRFWGNIGNKFPKAEFEQVGYVFAESEVRHADAYSRLLELLGLNDEFNQLLQNPVIQGRIDYLTKYLKNASSNSNEDYVLTLTLFSLFIENVSLFSQFFVIRSFNKHMNYLKDIDNAVQATMKEETVHALFGIHIVELIKKEFPEWFDEEFYKKIYRACRKAYDAEERIVDWIFDAGETKFLQKKTVKEFIKYRLNESVTMIGGEEVYEIDQEEIEKVKWFIQDIYAEVNMDFFHKKPVTYSKFTKPVTANDLF